MFSELWKGIAAGVMRSRGRDRKRVRLIGSGRVKVKDVPKSALERARARNARRKVSAGLTLYHESISAEVKNDTPSFLSRMLLARGGKRRQTSGSTAGAA